MTTDFEPEEPEFKPDRVNEELRYPLAQYMQSKYKIIYKFVGSTLHKDQAVEKVTKLYSKLSFGCVMVPTNNQNIM